MSDISFKALGVFCFSVVCFGVGTFLAGVLISGGDDDVVLAGAWLIGTIVFGIAMAVAYG